MNQQVFLLVFFLLFSLSLLCAVLATSFVSP